jgi:glutathione synthase/RimK-type ligase-like ATP-grasp enzyme
MSMEQLTKPIGIYYEHPEWFKPLFAELDRRHIPYVRLNAAAFQFNPAETESPYSLVFNRMSSSAYLRDHVQGIFFLPHFIAHLERLGVPVINGRKATAIETSKSQQLSLLTALGLSFPASRVVNHVSQILPAAAELQFPVVVKVSIGGSGAGIVRFDTKEGLMQAIDEGKINLGIDHTALVQEFVPARGGHITRVETLNGEFLYAMKVYTTGTSFNLCPAEICQIPDAETMRQADACVVEAPKKGIKVEACTPPAEIIEAVEKIVKAAGIDVGGIEYLIDDRDGKVLFYDINALSNFVADAVHVIGFDPYVKLVDFIEEKLEKTLQEV